MIFRAAATSLALIAAAAPAFAQSGAGSPAFLTPSPLPEGPELPGDDDLKCPVILAESKARQQELDRIEVERNGIVYQKGAGTQALKAAGVAAGMALPGPAGQIAARAALEAQKETTKVDAEANYGEIDARFEWVLDRMDHVHELYRTRCTAGGGH